MIVKSTWWVTSKQFEYATECILINMDNTVAVIETKMTLSQNQTVMICPFFANVSGLAPTRLEIKNRNDSIRGEVRNSLSKLRYQIQFDKLIETSGFVHPSDGAASDIRMDHYTVTISPTGELSLERFLHILEKTKEKLPKCIFIVFDFSKVRNFAKTIMPIFRDFIVRALQSKHKLVVVGPLSYCPKLDGDKINPQQFQHILQPDDLPSALDEMKVKTLVVEDDEIAAMQIERFLQNRGFDVTLASSAEEAISKTEQVIPHLIFMDIQLPGMSGIDAVKKLRHYFDHDSIPIIMLTADSSRDSVLSSMDAKVSGYVLKPFDVEKLSDEILNALTVLR